VPVPSPKTKEKETCAVAAFRALRRETGISMYFLIVAVCALANIPFVERSARSETCNMLIR
jgi:hypothetical protein